MTLLKKVNKINNIVNENQELSESVKRLQNDNLILKATISELTKSLALVSSNVAELSVIQKFLIDQTAKTSELMLEIDKLLNPHNHIKFDLMNEPYN